ncbi:MAG: carbamoyl phosphate synthase small subunit [Myxococcales bacterium]|nr:carbamoyl phosphate synthase small subunit [Myxococcales bacterium]
MKPKGALLVLADGRVFRGTSLGAHGTATGEVVFTTGMTGYQETLTDPSFAGQLITFTYPHIGNYGTNPVDPESAAIHAKGVIVRSATKTPSNQRATDSLTNYLREHRLVGIGDVDTRALTRHIRSQGSMPALIFSPFDADSADANEVLASLKETAAGIQGMAGQNLAHQVSCSQPYQFEGSAGTTAEAGAGPKVVVVDYGMKRNIAASLARRGASVTVVPASTSAQDIIDLKPDGVVLSNGPGDPDAVDGAPETVRSLLGQVPLFGICLGHQIMALAVGASTYKMKFGHRGVNQPVQQVGSHRVYITSQNHGFAVDPDTLPAEATATFICPNDGSLEGFELKDSRAMAVQFHPEACPGPQDTAFLFDQFIEGIR